MSNEVHEGKFTTVTKLTKDFDLTDEPLPFLVDGIIHESMTLLYGQTCSGKSTVAASLAIALANGTTHFLGRQVERNGQPLTVGIVTGDPNGGREYKRRIIESGHLGKNAVIYVSEPHRPTRRETWDEVHEVADEQGWQFVIVDNLSSFVPGSLSDDVSVKAFYEQIEDFPRREIPLLLVAHTSDKWSDHGPSRIPMGSSLIRFGPRWWINAYRTGGYLHLDFDGNEGTPHSIVVNEPDGNPRFEVVRTGEARLKRAPDTMAKRTKIRDYVLSECQGLNQAKTAEKVAETFGGKKSSHEVQLSRGAYYVRRDGNSWTRTLAAA